MPVRRRNPQGAWGLRASSAVAGGARAPGAPPPPPPPSPPPPPPPRARDPCYYSDRLLGLDDEHPLGSLRRLLDRLPAEDPLHAAGVERAAPFGDDDPAGAAASVTNPPPVTAAAPFEVSRSTASTPSCCPSVRSVLVACATKMAAI